MNKTVKSAVCFTLIFIIASYCFFSCILVSAENRVNNDICLKNGEKADFICICDEDGMYLLNIKYRTNKENSKKISVKIYIDGNIPESFANDIELKRVYKDASKIKQDDFGNDLIPKQEEIFDYNEEYICDNSGFYSGAHCFSLEKGKHTVTLEGVEGEPYVFSVTLIKKENPVSYKQALNMWKSEGIKEKDDYIKIYQAEEPYSKSSNTIYAVSDRNNAATVPSSPNSVKRNIIGGDYYKQSGDYISYKINVPNTGLYNITFKYRQNIKIDTPVYRTLLINNEIQYKELENLKFCYSVSWKNLTVADNKDYYVKLNKGENEIKIAVTIGEWSPLLEKVNKIVYDLNTVYRRIIMVTSTTPDSYRDYHLENEIENLSGMLSEYAENLNMCTDEFAKINNGNTSLAYSLIETADRLLDFSENIEDIPDQLSAFRENITSLSDWVQSMKEQPVEFDYFVVHSKEAELPKTTCSFFKNLKFKFLQFISAFSDSYGDISSLKDSNGGISLWINDGRDQAQLMKDIISDSFTESTGIKVNVNLVSGGVTEAVLSGRAPDIVVGASRGQPVNLASRNALCDISSYKNFSKIAKRFAPDALLPYTYGGKVYALPLTQYFLVMFYRTDIFDELGLNVPDTWDEFMDVSAKLQRNNMKVGLPYTAISATAAVDLGVGAKDLFPTLLLQYGGTYYNKNLTSSALNTNEALCAFKKWTSFYTNYGFDLSYDMTTLFRSGEMPLLVAPFTAFGLIDAVASEIHGNWEMTSMPGILNNDGSINRAGSASGSSVIILKDAENKENCYKFADWLTSDETQAAYGNRLEALLGVSARYATANLAAFDKLAWTNSQQKIILNQRKYIVETPEIPGSYYTSRCIDNAFRDVVYNNKNVRKSFNEQVSILNEELNRKLKELS